MTSCVCVCLRETEFCEGKMGVREIPKRGDVVPEASASALSFLP